jgi:hypothetical protein
MDSGATNHITSELEKLTARDKYHGGKQVHAANGYGMEITHIGHSTLCSLSSNIHLKNILCVPKASKNIVSIHRLTRVEFHLNHFLLRNRRQRKPSFKADVKEDFTPCGLLPVGHHHQIKKSTTPSSR